MIFNICLIVLGGIFCLYDVVLLILCPGTFLEFLKAFSHIWLVAGGWMIFVGLYRIKTKHSFWQNLKRWMKLTIVSLFYCGLFFSIVSLVFITNPKTVSLNEECDYMILLGGGIDKNGKLPKSVQKRVDKAAEYLVLHKDTICVVTGGQLKFTNFPEAPELKRQLVLRGIDENKILTDSKALDTIQNFQNSCEILSKETGKTTQEILDSKIVVVTSNFHLRRAERLASRMGFSDIKGVGSRLPWIYVPHMYVREICAYLKLNLRILITKKPSHL